MTDSSAQRLPYQAINEDTREIRILTILPDVYQSPIRCTLENVPLFEADDYEALSYTWGDPKLTTEIFVNDYSFQATLNLAAALEELRARGHSRLWIDAICIDQINLHEKGLQLLRMKAIYQKASNTVVWLGKESDGSSMAFEALEAISKKTSKGHDREIDDFRAADSSTRRAISRLFDRPYWTRVWIIQEVAVSVNVEIYCGKASIEWATFEAAFLRIFGLGEPATDAELWSDFFLAEELFENLRRFRLMMTKNEALHLLSALKYSATALATNQRDKVFALLGMTFDGSTFVSDPNYAQSERSIFMDMAKSRIVCTRSLDIICLKSFSQSNEWNLPSWTPDWLKLGENFPDRMIEYLCGRSPKIFVSSETARFGGRTETAFTASSNSTASFRIQGSLLKTRGIIFDTIDGLSSAYNLDLDVKVAPVHDDISQSTTPSGNAYGSKEMLFKSLFQTMSDFSFKNVPLDHHEDYKNVFTGLMTSSMQKRLDQSRFGNLIVWLDQNQDFLIDGQALQAYLTGTASQAKNRFKRFLDKVTDKGAEADVAEAVRVVIESGVRIMTTERGFVGRAHPAARKGDVLALLAGCSFPVILRPGVGNDRQFQVIGDAWVQGIMFGKMWEEAREQMQEIVLE